MFDRDAWCVPIRKRLKYTGLNGLAKKDTKILDQQNATQ